MSLNAPACLVARPLLKLLGLSPHDFTQPLRDWVKEQKSHIDPAQMMAVALLWGLSAEANVVKTLHEVRGYLRISHAQVPNPQVDLLGAVVEAVIWRLLSKRLDKNGALLSPLEAARSFVVEDFSGDRVQADLMMIVPLTVAQIDDLSSIEGDRAF
jgi:hypothetical protein